MKHFFFATLAVFGASTGFSQSPPVPLNIIPSRIVGHPKPEQFAPISVNPNLVEGREVFQPQGIALDTSVTPPVLYVSDTGNNRILVWKNALTFTNGKSADLVIGQPDFYQTAAGGPSGAF